MQIGRGRTFRISSRGNGHDRPPVGFSVDEPRMNEGEEAERVEEAVKRAVEQYREALEKLADE